MKNVLVIFTAGFCGACQRFKKDFRDEVIREISHLVEIVEIDTQGDTSRLRRPEALGVARAIPCFVLIEGDIWYNNNIPFKYHMKQGIQNASMLRDWIAEVFPVRRESPKAMVSTSMKVDENKLSIKNPTRGPPYLISARNDDGY
jgi:hypothetical protein